MTYTNDLLFCTDLPTQAKPELGKILVTGATGYIGSILVPELIARGYNVRVLVRNNAQVNTDRWPGTEIITGDASNIKTLKLALEGVHTAYYLIHSMLLGKSEFDNVDIQIAENFRKVAEEKNLLKIIYLSGLGNTHSKLSKHLNSRSKVAAVLSKGKVPVIVLRAAIIIGSGSASYKIIKHLSRYAPLVLIPPWAKTKCQPIAIRDVIKYMAGVLEIDKIAGRYFDIGGKDILTYERMIRTMVRLLGKKKLFISVPFSSTFLFGNLASLFTSVPAALTKCLIEGCKNDVICCENDITKILPFEPLPYDEAIKRALKKEEKDR